MRLNIEETSDIFDITEDEELKKYIEECDKTIANILGNMKNSDNNIKKKSIKRNDWLEYVREVKKEMDSKNSTPTTFAKAVSEASRRKKLEKNISKLNTSRNERLEKNRRSVRFPEEIKKDEEEINPITIKTTHKTLPKHIDVKITYTYRYIDNEKLSGMSRYVYESYKKCLCIAILDYIENYTRYLDFSWTSSKIFIKDAYSEKFTDITRLFLNCWFHKYFNIVYDDTYKDKIVDLDFNFFNSLDIYELEYILTFLNTVSKTQTPNFPELEIIDMGYVVEKK